MRLVKLKMLSLKQIEVKKFKNNEKGFILNILINKTENIHKDICSFLNQLKFPQDEIMKFDTIYEELEDNMIFGEYESYKIFMLSRTK